MRKVAWTTTERETLTKLWSKGLLTKQIAHEMNRTEHAIKGAVRRFKLPNRQIFQGGSVTLRVAVPRTVFALLDKHPNKSAYVRRLIYKDLYHANLLIPPGCSQSSPDGPRP